MNATFRTLAIAGSLGLTLFAADATSANCMDPVNAPRYTVARKGDMVCDRNIRGLWMRCSYGQNWSMASGKCEGVPYRTSGAELEELLATANSKGWELPTKAQLAAILESAHGSPKVDPVVFPSTAPGAYWTIEALAQWREKKSLDAATIDFSAEADQNASNAAGAGYFVRLLLIPGSAVATRAGFPAH